MISTILFSLSALCIVAIFVPSQPPPRATRSIPTYSFGDDQPLPTWQKKIHRPAGVVARHG